MKYFPGANAPANDQNGDQQNCRHQQADLQTEEGKNQQTDQRKGTHPNHDGKCHSIEMAGDSIQHRNFPGMQIPSYSTAMALDA